ncbi:Hypothetical predicted protein [Drosophila guanche]|uniref:Uncharacterized protein n=1 Tax=Drosophila guanche TaxID=7266 RepID=A0A3B0J728_DROGU|nr:Hypothetical predicted protein [Drosophila guanche]
MPYAVCRLLQPAPAPAPTSIPIRNTSYNLMSARCLAKWQVVIVTIYGIRTTDEQTRPAPAPATSPEVQYYTIPETTTTQQIQWSQIIEKDKERDKETAIGVGGI